MNKYVKLTSLFLLIALTFIGFSIYKAQASSPYSQMKVVTTEGKPEYIEPVDFFGYVSHSQNFSNSSTIEFNDGAFSYLQEKPFLKRMDHSFDPKLNDLVDNHRSFMRGKSRRPEQYTETDQHLIYAGSKTDVDWNSSISNQMTISVLDKASDEEEAYSVTIGDDGAYNDVYATYIDYPTLTIFVNRSGVSDTSRNLVYTFDIENPTEALTEVVDLSDYLDKNETLSVSQLSDKTERYIPLKTVRQTVVSDYDYTTETSGYFAYDVEAQEVIEIPPLEEETLLFSDNDTIYVGKPLNESIELYEMNPDDKEMTLLGTLEMATPIMGQEDSSFYSDRFNQSVTILDGKLYTYGQEYVDEVSRPIFQITDVHTQETLFKGTVMPKDMTEADATSIEVMEYRLDPLRN